MKNKKCLGFLILTIILVISMFSSAFANSLGSWTCTQESRTKFTVGQVLENVSCLNITADGQHSESCTFVSDFDVEPGDVVSISFAASCGGDKNRVEEAVSACGAFLKDENGNTGVVDREWVLRNKDNIANVGISSDGKICFANDNSLENQLEIVKSIYQEVFSLCFFLHSLN